MLLKLKTNNQQLVTKSGFTLIELLVVISIIGVLSIIGMNSFNSSRTKARDSKRKTDLSSISKALELYYNDFGEYPDDDASGNIKGCGVGAIETCTWGSSVFSNTTTGQIYMTKLPADSNSSYSYYYESFTNAGLNTSYQLYARLENIKDIAINKDASGNPQIYTNRTCGTPACNYGISSSNITPTDNGHDLITE